MKKEPNIFPGPDDLDALDLRLLSALQRDGHSTYAELGEAVGLTSSAVHGRVKRLERRGYVRGYAAQLDGKLLGLELVALVGCYTTPDCIYDNFIAALTAMPEICEIHSVAGEESFLLKVMTRSTAHLDELLSRLKSVPGMARTKTSIVLSTPFERGIPVQ